MEVGQTFYVVPCNEKDEEGDANDAGASLLGPSGVGLRHGLVEGRDFRLLDMLEWEKWKADSRRPAVEIPRHVITRGSGSRAQHVVELYPLLVEVHYWANGMAKSAPIQMKKGVNLNILVGTTLNVSSIKRLLWSRISSRYHDLFPEYAKPIDVVGYKAVNEDNWAQHIRVCIKSRRGGDVWEALDESPISPLSDDDDVATQRTVGDLNLIGEADSCVLLIECQFLNPSDAKDPRNSLFYMSEVEALGWRRMLQFGDYLDAKDTSNHWYESQVVDIDLDKDRVKVHYLSWGEKWDVWFARNAPELQPLHSQVGEWRTTLSKGDAVEFGTGSTPGMKASWVEGTVVDVQSMDDDHDTDDEAWPPMPPKALYKGKVIRVKVQYMSGGLPHTKVVEASNQLLCLPNVHIRSKKQPAQMPQSTATSTDVVKSEVKSSYSYSSGTYTATRNTNWSTPSGGYSAYTSKYSEKAEFPGVVGLQNLGNTCFMNSVLQCLSNTKPLLEYFCQVDEGGELMYKREINRSNPLGMGGKIAKAYAMLMEKMWSGDSKVVTPTELKYVIGEYAPAFAGYSQQDSQEVLSFILDGIHEDLNRVLDKPYTNPIEHAGRPDADVAKEEWANYLKRNDSIIVDHCMAQLRSHVTCPSCQNESITFDPYMTLSVPVPNQAWVLLTLHGIGARPMQYGLHVPKEGVYADVKATLTTLCGIPTDRLLLVQIKNNRIVRAYSDTMDISDLVHAHRDATVAAFELEYPWNLNQSSPGEVALCLVALQHQVPSEVTEMSSPLEDDSDYHTSSSYRYHTNHSTKHRRVERRLFGTPSIVTITRDASSAEIHDKIRQLTEHLVDPDLEETPYKLHISNARADAFLQKDIPEDSADPLPCDVTRGSFTFTLEWTPHGYKVGRKGSESPRLHASADTAISHGGKPAAALDLRTCIAKFTEKEQLGENDTWYCPKCKTHVRAFKKFDLFSLPNILLLHLKRFRYAQGSYSMQRDKINTLVTFPITDLDMADFVVGDIPPNTSTVYDLYAVSEHMGGLGGGHYTAKAMNPRNNKWYSFNDSCTSDTTPEAAITSHAYVLFYLRRDLPAPK
ncbi:hypothetical protein, variant [Aphanomyces invadans]|uniref:USP domain-containing protein n=1 Tax=Aphanomyces invadans TaxID=157072 RepID=A0A024UUW7_9STRA|nr:hypothetical protein, variant [Aphanomyces invadans]ETW09727.1 hypothetical protein, variant [Aphanomyces invadans]|eukprot:XP_008861138.1 hypothetical protein, variant [Aphanomyces invadans]